MRKSLIIFIVALSLFGCLASPEKPTFPESPYAFSEIHTKLNEMAAYYDQARETLKKRYEAGEIGGATWAYLQEVDSFFSEKLSETVINVNDIYDPGYDWKNTLAVLVEILQVAAPVIDMAAGTPISTSIATAIKIGTGLLSRHTKREINREDSRRLVVLKWYTKAILKP